MRSRDSLRGEIPLRAPRPRTQCKACLYGRFPGRPGWTRSLQGVVGVGFSGELPAQQVENVLVGRSTCGLYTLRERKRKPGVLARQTSCTAGVLAKRFEVNLRGWGRAGRGFPMSRVEGKGAIRASTSLLVEWVDSELVKELNWGPRRLDCHGVPVGWKRPLRQTDRDGKLR